jgi:hypothetical protein
MKIIVPKNIVIPMPAALVAFSLCCGLAVLGASAQTAPTPTPTTAPAPVDPHDEVVRLRGVAGKLLKDYQACQNEAMGSAGDLASEHEKVSSLEAHIQALEKQIAAPLSTSKPPVSTPAPAP